MRPPALFLFFFSKINLGIQGPLLVLESIFIYLQKYATGILIQLELNLQIGLSSMGIFNNIKTSNPETQNLFPCIYGFLNFFSNVLVFSVQIFCLLCLFLSIH